MNKISTLTKEMAHFQFQQKRKEILRNILSEQQKSKSYDFQEVINLYFKN